MCRGREEDINFGPYLARSVVRLGSSLHSLVSGDTVSEIPGGLHEVEARTLRVPA